MRLRPLLLAAVLCGAALAAGLALGLRDADPGRAAPAGDPFAGGVAPVPGPPAVAPAGEPRLGGLEQRIVSRPRIVRRVADPDGGPAWAIRAFGARPFFPGADGRPRLHARRTCMQLGRLHAGRFGWIDGRNVFRPVGADSDGAPQQCGAAGAWYLEDMVERVTRITHPTPGRGRPQAIQTVEWGFGAEAGDPPVLRVGTNAAERAERAEYRVADPDGGLPWGMVRSVDPGAGAPCLPLLGQLVGGRAGHVDRRLDTLVTQRVAGRACPAGSTTDVVTRQRPLFVIAGSGTVGVTLNERRQTRVVRRTLGGLTSLAGRAHPDVESVTIASPRDVRTLTPSPHDRVFAVVWDGTFPTGEIRLTARMRDGSVRQQTAALHSR